MINDVSLYLESSLDVQTFDISWQMLISFVCAVAVGGFS